MADNEQKCIGRESNPGLAESLEMISHMATANFTTKPPMLEGCSCFQNPAHALYCDTHVRAMIFQTLLELLSTIPGESCLQGVRLRQMVNVLSYV